jgi:NAD(P)-dependent dehydrogenase (short-subunit alcohol dehydrogenase family)
LKPKLPLGELEPARHAVGYNYIRSLDERLNVEQWDEAAFDRSFAINVKGPYFLVQALLPIFTNPASIVLNASVNAHIGMPNTSVYAATKAALLSLARTLSGELISRGIRVNAVSPGPISTPLYSKLGLSEADLKTVAASIQSQVPTGRFAKPGEIAHAIVFLASDESAFTVGSELLVDGRMSNL